MSTPTSRPVTLDADTLSTLVAVAQAAELLLIVTPAAMQLAASMAGQLDVPIPTPKAIHHAIATASAALDQR